MMATKAEMRIDPEEMREAAVRLLADKVDRRAPWDGRDSGGAALDEAMAALGWHLLTVPESCGGLEQGFDALAPIYEELGRALAPVWVSGTMATIDLLAEDGSESSMATVKGIAEQNWRVATVFLPMGQGLQHARIPMVGGADSASHLLVITSDDEACWLIPIDAAGISIRSLKTWDLSRDYAEVALKGVETVGVARLKSSRVAIAHTELALAWDSIGGASQCLSETVEYMLGREQFGRPIASFQALKHRAADHKVSIELARALASHASAVYANRGEGWSRLATQARLLAGEAYNSVSEDSVQLFGGVGFTWEYSCHLFLKRALVNQIIGGAPDELRDRIAPSLLNAVRSAHL